MKKTLLILIMNLIIVNSYGQNNNIKVKLHSVTGYGKYEEFANRAVVELENVLNSNEFKERVKSGKFIRTNDLNNQQLLDTIIFAKEIQGPGGENYVVDLRARTLRIHSDESKWKNKCKIGSRAGTIGIDGNGDGVTAICPQRLEKWGKENNIASLAGHYAHEYMHILGFSHYKFLSRDKWRQKTFVYQIGNIVNELITKRLNNQSN